MNKNDIIRKLTSRKFWLAIAAFITELIVAFKGDAETAETISGMIMAGATVIAYVLGEGLIDAANVSDSCSDMMVKQEGGQGCILSLTRILKGGFLWRKHRGRGIRRWPALPGHRPRPRHFIKVKLPVRQQEAQRARPPGRALLLIRVQQVIRAVQVPQ